MRLKKKFIQPDKIILHPVRQNFPRLLQIAEIESRIPALEDRVKRTKLYAPVKGVVNRINFKTLGGFVTTGDIILELVPTGDDLIVEGKIDPKDIAYIQPDQNVRISLTAYDARYGTIDGKVSADAVEENQLV